MVCTREKAQQYARMIWPLAISLMLAACGGGGSGATSAPAPTPPSPPPAVVPPPASIAELQLPLELLSDGGAPYVAEAVLNLNSIDLTSANTLAFTCHRCAFSGAPEWEKTSRTPTAIKASVRVLGNIASGQEGSVPWVDITDANVKMPPAERLQGGLGGSGLYTTRLQLRLDAATLARLTDKPSGNRIQFRFNGTEGESNGYRIIKLNFQDASGKGLATNSVRQADIAAEKKITYSTADVTAGDVLWHQGGKLSKSSIVARTLNGSCASCHAEDGRDLQYFNYSDNAIVQRSRFHGLSDAQAKQIVAYVRSNEGGAIHVAQAAPWNPPYQPGPGLDAKDVREWAAGAGLDMVLDDSAHVSNALFGAQQPKTALVPVTQAMVDNLFDPTKSNNVRETAISLQLPDWNAWLPAIAPEDVWPDSRAGGGADWKGSFNQGAAFSGDAKDLSQLRRPKQKVEELNTWLTTNKGASFGSWAHLNDKQRTQASEMMGNLGWESMRMAGGGRGNKFAPSGKWGAQVGGDYLNTFTDANTAKLNPLGTNSKSMIERAVLSIRQWSIVNQWSLAQKHGLEGDQKVFVRDYGSSANKFIGKGEKRGWALDTAGVFWVGAHVANTDETGSQTWIFQWEDPNTPGPMYRNNIWYDLAMVIHQDNGIDWPYHARLTGQLIQKTAQVDKSSEDAMNLARGHELRMMQIKARTGQKFTDLTPIDQMTDTIVQLMPSYWIVERLNTESRYSDLNKLQPNFYKLFLGGSLYQYNAVHGSTSGRKLADFRRCDPNADIERVDLNDYDRRKLLPYDGVRMCLDPQRGPNAITNAKGEMINWINSTTYDALLFSVLKGNQLGADSRHVDNLMSWIDQAWPGAPTSADIEATLAVPATAAAGQEVTVTATCRNLGNGGYTEATGVAINATCGIKGFPANSGVTTPYCKSASLNANASFSCTVKFRPPTKGTLTLVAYGNSHSYDPTPFKNGEQSKTLQVN